MLLDSYVRPGRGSQDKSRGTEADSKEVAVLDLRLSRLIVAVDRHEAVGLAA